MKTLATTLGMTDPPEPQVPAVARTNETDQELIERGNAELDTIVKQGLTAMQETFAKATDWKPSDANRAREVGAQIMKATIDAIKQKQDTAAKSLDRKTKPASVTAVPTTQTTNIIADRNTVLKLLRESGVVGPVIEAKPSEEPGS